MRFSMPSSLLLPVLGPLAQLASRSSQALPALRGILVEAKADKLRLTANNAIVGLSVTLDRPSDVVEAYEEGKALIPYSVSDLLRNVDGLIEVDVQDSVAAIQYPGGHARLGSMDPDNFPIPNFSKTSFEISVADLKAGLQRVGFATAKRLDDHHPLDHVEMSMKAGSLRWAATDRSHGAVFTTNVEATSETTAWAPLDALGLVAKLCTTERVRLGVNERGFTAVWGTTKLFSRVNDSPFPQFLEMLPPEYPITATVDVGKLRDALMRVSTTAEKEVVLKLRDGFIVFSAAYAGGNSEEQVPATVTGGEVDVLFHPPLLAEALAHVPGSEVTIGVVSAEDPIRLLGDSQGFQFVMPMMDEKTPSAAGSPEEAA